MTIYINKKVTDGIESSISEIERGSYYGVSENYGITQVCVRQALSIIYKYGTDAHVYIAGVGQINGLTAGNYLENTLTTLASVDSTVGGVVDAKGTINATQATAGSRPTLRSSGGNYYLEFDGTNDYLSLASVPFQMSDDHCVITSFTPINYTTNRCVISPSDNGSTIRYASIHTTPSGTANIEWYDGTNYVSHNSPSHVVNTPMVVSARKASSILVSRKDGVQFGSTASFSTALQSTLSYIGNGVHPKALNNTFASIVIKGTVSDADLLILEKFAGLFAGVTI